MKTLGQRIKSCREARGLTQGELGKSVGLDQTVISKLERGDMQETTKIVQLAQSLRVSAQWLATGKGQMGNATDPDPMDMEYMRLFSALPPELKLMIIEQTKLYTKIKD